MWIYVYLPLYDDKLSICAYSTHLDHTSFLPCPSPPRCLPLFSPSKPSLSSLLWEFHSHSLIPLELLTPVMPTRSWQAKQNLFTATEVHSHSLSGRPVLSQTVIGRSVDSNAAFKVAAEWDLSSVAAQIGASLVGFRANYIDTLYPLCIMWWATSAPQKRFCG